MNLKLKSQQIEREGKGRERQGLDIHWKIGLLGEITWTIYHILALKKIMIISKSQRGDALTVKLRRHHNGEKVHWAKEHYAMLVGSDLSRVGYYPNIDPQEALALMLSSTQIFTGKS